MIIITIALAFIIPTVTAVNAVAMRAIHTATVAAGCVNPRRPACQTHGRPSPCARHPARPARRPSLNSRNFTFTAALFSANFSPGGRAVNPGGRQAASPKQRRTRSSGDAGWRCDGRRRRRTRSMSFRALQRSRTWDVNVARLMMVMHVLI